MAEVKMRLNLDTEEVELVVDGQVALTSGQDVLHSWVEAINTKHKPHRSLDEPVVEETKEEPVVEVKEAEGEINNDEAEGKQEA